MDELVARAMARWPDVPAVFGWLALDRRGQWRVRLSERDAQTFERIGNPALTDFIGRNYEADELGRYFFQNGPQRVYVALDYTPWVLRLSDDGAHLVTHTNVPVQGARGAWLDEHGTLLLAFERGVGVVLDRDLDALTEAIRDAHGVAVDGEALIERVCAGEAVDIRLFGTGLTLAPIAANQVPRRFRFVMQPQPADR